MKRINEVFDDEEMGIIEKAKGEKTWHDWILDSAKRQVK